jgi:hypothetical protein
MMERGMRGCEGFLTRRPDVVGGGSGLKGRDSSSFGRFGSVGKTATTTRARTGSGAGGLCDGNESRADEAVERVREKGKPEGEALECSCRL